MILQFLLILALYGAAAVAVVILVQAIVRISKAVDRISQNLDEIATFMGTTPKR